MNMNDKDKAKWNDVKEVLNNLMISTSEIEKMDDSNWDVATMINYHIKSAINKIEENT